MSREIMKMVVVVIRLKAVPKRAAIFFDTSGSPVSPVKGGYRFFTKPDLCLFLYTRVRRTRADIRLSSCHHDGSGDGKEEVDLP